MEVERATDRIEAEYERAGYNRGWRLLSCPWRNLRTADVAIITMNPGGDEFQAPRVSVQDGCAYRLESWHGHIPGESPLQRQLLRLCAVAGAEPDDVLSACFVPFRSHTWSALPHKDDAISFSKSLWRDLLGPHRPRLVFTLGSEMFRSFGELLSAHSATAVPSGYRARGQIPMREDPESFGLIGNRLP